MLSSRWLKTAAIAAAALGTVGTVFQVANSSSAIAASFNQQEVDQSKFAVVAAPYGNQSYKLLVLEQISSSRSCWSEKGAQPTIVDPLLVNFDFTGICGRSTDSNGYSMRMAGEDLGLKYNLRLVKRNNDIVLLGRANANQKSPEIEIGRTQGLTTGFSKIILNSGWRLTKRVYNGRPLGHVYLTNDQSLSNWIASTGAGTSTSPRPTTPSTGSTPPVVSPSRPTSPQPPASQPKPSPTTPANGSGSNKPSNPPAAPTQPTPKPTPPNYVVPVVVSGSTAEPTKLPTVGGSPAEPIKLPTVIVYGRRTSGSNGSVSVSGSVVVPPPPTPVAPLNRANATSATRVVPTVNNASTPKR